MPCRGGARRLFALVAARIPVVAVRLCSVVDRLGIALVWCLSSLGSPLPHRALDDRPHSPDTGTTRFPVLGPDFADAVQPSAFPPRRCGRNDAGGFPILL